MISLLLSDEFLHLLGFLENTLSHNTCFTVRETKGAPSKEEVEWRLDHSLLFPTREEEIHYLEGSLLYQKEP